MAGTDDQLSGDRLFDAPGVSVPGPPEPQADPAEELRRRRRRAEAAAAAAEAAAADAATRASAAIAAASRAAADAEAAADAAARAADEVEAAAAAERAASATDNDPTADEITTVGVLALPAIPLPGYPQMPRPRPRIGPPPDAEPQTVVLPVTRPDPADAVTPATGGRASRRRAQEAAAEVAEDATRDPETQVIPPGTGDAARPVQRVIRSVRAQFDLRTGITAGAVATVLLVAGVLAYVLGGPAGLSSVSSATPAAASPAATAAPVASAAPAVAPTSAAPTDAASDAPVDPTSPKAVGYLAALRAAGVPTSDSGESEIQAGAVICQQLAKGTDAAELVQALPAVLPSVNSKQARSMVELATSKYC